MKNILENLEPDDAYIIERIIEKNPKIGMGTSNINKVFKKLIEKVAYMGAKPYDISLIKKVFENGGYGYSDIKMDGRFNNSIIRSSEIENKSRQGEDVILDNALFIKELEQFDDCVLNGELTMLSDDKYKISRYEANGIISSLIDITKKRDERSEEETNKKILAFEKKHMPFNEALDRIVYTVWDVITVDEYYDNKSDIPFEQRRQNLINLLSKHKCTRVVLVESKIVNSLDECLEHFQECLNRGEEGTILKAYDAIWRDGKPSNQIKLKLEMTVELKI